MQSLQHANTILSDAGFLPVVISKHQFIRERFICSPQKLQIHCPMRYLGWAMSKISELIGGGYKVTYQWDGSMINIKPSDSKFQYIVNLLYNCETPEQAQSVGRLVEIHYPHNEELHSILNSVGSELC